MSDVMKIVDQLKALHEAREKAVKIIRDNNDVIQTMRKMIEKYTDDEHRLLRKMFEELGLKPDQVDDFY